MGLGVGEERGVVLRVGEILTLVSDSWLGYENGLSYSKCW
jgi:hypothetical protein